MSVTVEFKPQDLWIGAFWKSEFDGYRPYTRYTVWVCILPMLPIRISWQREVESFKKYKRDHSQEAPR